MKAIFFLFIVLLFPFYSFSEGVITSISPVKFFIDKIAPGTKTLVLVKPGRDAHSYDPKPSEMIAVSKADLYLKIGLPEENIWLKKLISMNKNINILDISYGIKRYNMIDREDNHAHSREGMLDPHIWLSPMNSLIICRNITKVFCEKNKELSSSYLENFKSLSKQIIDLDIKIKKLFLNKKEHDFLVFHPAWGYFSRDYGLTQISIEKEGKSPKSKDLMQLINYCKNHNINTLFVQPERNSQVSNSMASNLSANIVTIDPLAYNWIKNIYDVAEKIAESLK